MALVPSMALTVPMDTPVPGAGIHRLIDSKPIKMG